MGLDFTVYAERGAQEVDTRRGNSFVAAYRNATGTNLIEGIDADEWHCVITNGQMRSIVVRMNNPKVRMDMALFIENRGSMNFFESIEFIDNFHAWFKLHAEAGHRIVVC